MQLFGIDLWRIILCAVLIALVVMRGNIAALLGKIKFAKGDTAGALKVLSIADKIGNMNAANKELYGYVLLREGYPDKAEVQLRSVLPMTKRESAARYKLKNLLALAYWKQGNLDEAIEELEEVTDAGYKTTQIYQNLGILYNLAEDRQKGIKFNLEAKEYDSDDHIILDNLADAYALNGEYDKAAEIYESLMEMDPKPRFPEAYYGYGKVLINLGETEKGLKLIEESLDKPFSYLSVKSRDEVKQMLEEYKSNTK